MAFRTDDINVLRSREGDRNVRHAYIRNTLLDWTGPWYAFFLAFTVAWGNGLLKAFSVGPLSYAWVFPVALVVACLVVAARNFDEDGMFDQPAVFAVVLVCALIGTALVALQHTGVALGTPMLMCGYALSGVAAALLFVLWSEVLARFSVSRALFYLCSDMVFAAVILWFLDHMDATAGYAAMLLCALASCVGVHRAWESFRGAAPDMQSPTAQQTLSETAAGRDAAHDGRHPDANRAVTFDGFTALSHTERRRASRLPIGIFVALFVYVVSVILMKSLGHEAPMGYVSYGVAFGPLAMLVLIVWGRRLPLSILYELALIIALVALLAQPLFGRVGDTVGIVASDAVLGLLILLLAAVGIILVHQRGYSISRLGAVGAILLVAAIIIGCGLSELVKSAFPWGTGLPVLTACLFAVVICTLICLAGNRHFSYDMSMTAAIAASQQREAASQQPSGAAPSQEGPVGSASNATRGDAPHAEALQSEERARNVVEPAPDHGSNSAAALDSTEEATLGDDAFFGPDGDRAALCGQVRTIAQEQGLHEREAEVMLLLLTGMTSSEVAGELCIALGTVKAHTHNIYAKLGVHSRDELRDYVSAHRRQL